MNPYDSKYITDEEFVPFLGGLGVETYNKSFEWMLNDPDFSGVLRWLHRNLDAQNALTAREDCRYEELKKKGALLPKPELEATLNTIQSQHEGLPSPGDHDALEDMQMEVQMLKEQLDMLETQENVLKQLDQNDLCNDLNCEIAKLHASITQSKEDEEFAQQECLALAEELQGITDDIVEVIGDALDLYSNCHLDKETSSQFFAFGDWESYKQSQALFSSYFDLYVSKRLLKKQADLAATEKEIRISLAEAQSMEERLSVAITAYIESKAELSGEQAKLALLTDYEYSRHQTDTETIEAQSSLDSAEHNESLLERRLSAAVAGFVRRRARDAQEKALRHVLECREDILHDLNHLLSLTQQALALDSTVYYALRYELRAVQDVVQFAGDLREHLDEEDAAVRSRIDSMTSITREQEIAYEHAKKHDVLEQALCLILGTDSESIPRCYFQLNSEMRELAERMHDAFRRREAQIEAIKASHAPLRAYLWDGCTKQPNCRHRAVSALLHTLKRDMNTTDCKLVEASSLFIGVKTGDTDGLRKLWQLFLADPTGMFNAIKDAQSKSYS